MPNNKCMFAEIKARHEMAACGQYSIDRITARDDRAYLIDLVERIRPVLTNLDTLLNAPETKLLLSRAMPLEMLKTQVTALLEETKL